MTDDTTDQKLTITLYSRPSCVQCTASKRHMDGKGIVYETVDVSLEENEKDLLALKSLNYLTAPVTLVSNGDVKNDVHWGGYQPHKIDEHIQKPLGIK